MNQIAFATKRTFHGFLRVTRKALASVGLTAARFDMLSALYGDHDRLANDCQLISQRELRDDLGVSASVISRMVRALEALGLVKRERWLGDRRQFWVFLTDLGWDCIRKAQRLLLRGVQRIVCDATSTWILSRATSASCEGTSATRRSSTTPGVTRTISRSLRVRSEAHVERAFPATKLPCFKSRR
jgi:DNA-binding MarR family transcriptional regulator